MANLSAVPSPASIRTLTSSEQLAQLDSAAWDRLVSAAARPSPYLLSTWVRSWLAEPSFECEQCVVVAERDGELVGAAPFIVRKQGPARIASFVGVHESALGDILLAEGESSATSRSLLDGVVASARPHAFDVFGLPSDSHLARDRRRPHVDGRAGRVAGHRDARRLGRRVRAPRERAPPQQRPAARPPARRGRRRRLLVRDGRRWRPQGSPGRLRAAPDALGGAPRRLVLRHARRPALPARGAAAARRRGPLLDADRAHRRRGPRRSRPGSRSERASTSTATAMPRP